MAISAMTVRMDSQIKKQFDTLCQQFGMSSNTAINVFIKQVVRSRSIPFVVTLDSPVEKVSARAFASFARQREKAESGGTPELTLDQINEEIGKARLDRKQREQKQQV